MDMPTMGSQNFFPTDCSMTIPAMPLCKADIKVAQGFLPFSNEREWTVSLYLGFTHLLCAYRSDLSAKGMVKEGLDMTLRTPRLPE